MRKLLWCEGVLKARGEEERAKEKGATEGTDSRKSERAGNGKRG